MFASLSVTTADVPLIACPLPPSTAAADPSTPLCLFVSAALSAPDGTATTVRLDIAQHFADLPDPRHRAFRDRHLLSDILVIALTGVMCGAKSWEAIADFGTTKQNWFRSIGLQLPNGIPAHDTFHRIFAALDPLAFQRSFTSWINAVCHSLGFCQIPIDGKAIRGSRGPDGTCLHLVSAWVCEHRLTLAQIAVADKSNEITAIPQLLKMLDVRGALVSIDAMGCQKAIAQQIRDDKGDYLLAVKDNQPTLYGDVQHCFEQAYEGDFVGLHYDTYTTQEVSHGRQEERICTVLYEPIGLSSKAEWVDLKAIVQVIRTVQRNGKETVEVAYYISSSLASAKILAEAVRKHLSIENQQHWCLDVLFGEDRCRTRQGNASQNLAWLRKMTLSLFGQDQSKGTIPTRQFRAAADDAYRLHLLQILGEKSA
jgi:predicted transposase YbfD/YdcC